MAHVLRAAALVTMLYPVAVLALIYGNWLVARVELGRWPVALLDDPKHVGSVTPVVHAIAAWGIAAGFSVSAAGALLLAFASIWQTSVGRRWAWTRLGVAVLATLVLYEWCRIDPGRVVEWFVD